jgi:probable HAF family extracellular repeat protein
MVVQGMGRATDINNDGYIVGYGYAGGFKNWSFLYDGNSYTEILPPGWFSAYAEGINENGDVVGWGTHDMAGKGFLYSNGTYTEFDNFRPGNTKIYDINNNGDLIGGFRDPETYIDMGFIATLIMEPISDIKANGSDIPIDITRLDSLSVIVELDSGDYSGDNADWWALVNSPFGWYYYHVSNDSWEYGWNVTYQGPLFELSSYEILNMSGLPIGDYTFYFGVDIIMNGSLDLDAIYYDSVAVTVTP